MTATDPLTGFLDGPRARGSFHLRVVMSPPWSMSIADAAPLSVVAVLKGECWFQPQNELAHRLQAGDVLLARAGQPYQLAATPGAEPTITIGAGQTCSGVDGRFLADDFSRGLRTWGNDANGGDHLLVGSYLSEDEVGRMMLAALPGHALLSDPAPQVIELLADELERQPIGQSVTLDRLLDVLFISCVRVWAREDPRRQTWLAASCDPVVREGLRLIHSRPDHPWTVEALAASSNVSRAVFARRFTALVGESPMAYATRWRLARGADLLAEGMTLDAIATQVGYGSGFSFSAAFKRVYGYSPAEHRRRRTTAAATPVSHRGEAR